MPGHLHERVVLVTGGGSGIGRATALSFAREGAKVVVADIDLNGGNETVELIQGIGGQALFFQADVTKTEDVQATVMAAVSGYGRLDCAFNNAGISGPSGVSANDYPEDAWDLLISVNLTGVWLCMKYEVQQMLKQGAGSIVNMASAAGLVAHPNLAYCASKHGVIGLTRSAAVNFSDKGIRINAVCPGYINTPMINQSLSDPATAERLNSVHPIGRVGTPQEVAETVIWLCSDAASFVTGHALAVDGGYVAR